jgi:hypothetical protein
MVLQVSSGSHRADQARISSESNGADFSYQLHLRVIKKDSLHPAYLP